MKKLLFFLFFSMLITEFTANATYKSDEFSLKNGMKVIMIERKSVPIISLSVWYKGGSDCDMPFKSGVAHFLEHLAFLNHKQEFSNYLDEIGAEKNAFTSVNTICFYEIFPKDCLEKVLFFESRRMRSLEIEPEVFLNEKKAILEERGMRIDADVQGRYGEAFLSNIFNRQVGGISIIGWKHEIESIGIDDLQAFYRTRIVPNNATMILVGDFEKKSARQLIEKYFGTIPQINLSATPDPHKEEFNGNPQKDPNENCKELDKKLIECRSAENGPSATKLIECRSVENGPSATKLIECRSAENGPSATKLIECRSVENGPSATVKYVFKVPFLSKNNLRKSIALTLALEILEQPSSFIKNILKQMNQIVSDVDFSYMDSIYQFDILVVIFDATSIDNSDKIETAWPYLKNKISAGCISESSLQEMKKKKLISLAYKKEDIEKISSYFGWNLISGLSMKEILSIDDIIQSITAKECNDVLKEIFSSPPITIMKTLPKGFDRD